MYTIYMLMFLCMFTCSNACVNTRTFMNTLVEGHGWCPQKPTRCHARVHTYMAMCVHYHVHARTHTKKSTHH